MVKPFFCPRSCVFWRLFVTFHIATNSIINNHIDTGYPDNPSSLQREETAVRRLSPPTWKQQTYRTKMGVFYETIPNSLVPWIKEQQMLWVGSAPLSGEGHINISPKGGQNFGILDERTFWYMDLTGSGVETHAHLHEPGNGRICVMVSHLHPRD